MEPRWKVNSTSILLKKKPDETRHSNCSPCLNSTQLNSTWILCAHFIGFPILGIVCTALSTCVLRCHRAVAYLFRCIIIFYLISSLWYFSGHSLLLHKIFVILMCVCVCFVLFCFVLFFILFIYFLLLFFIFFVLFFFGLVWFGLVWFGLVGGLVWFGSETELIFFCKSKIESFPLL